MKKIGIMLTASAMALAMSGTANAAEYTDLTENDACYAAASRLYDFEIMGGYEDGSFRPDKEITRAEFARLLASALNMDEYLRQGYQYNNDFIDVPREHWASAYISFIAAEADLQGYDDGTFRPEQTITYAEMSKILVNITGYRIYAEKNGGYPSGYIMQAAALKITEGLQFGIKDNVSRGNAAIMINNTLDVPLLYCTGFEMNSDGAMISTFEMQNGEGEEYQTLLTKCLHIYEVNAEKPE